MTGLMKPDRICTVLGGLRLERAANDDYKWLFGHHYRNRRTGPLAGVWVLRPNGRSIMNIPPLPVAVICYGYPSANLAARSACAPGQFPLTAGRTDLGELNRRLRTIRRVIVDPRWRSLGLAADLVRRTLPRVGTEYVEAVTVMGPDCDFFERAGMRAYHPAPRPEALALQQALLDCKIPERLWWDSRAVGQRMEKLDPRSQTALKKRITAFLKPYKNRRAMPPGLPRLRFVLSRLSARPAYYLWYNPQTASSSINAA